MNAYLLTNALTGAHTWTPGSSLHVAMLTHENARRALLNLPLLSRGSKIGLNHEGCIDAWMGETRCRGLRCNVVREEAVP